MHQATLRSRAASRLSRWTLLSLLVLTPVLSACDESGSRAPGASGGSSAARLISNFEEAAKKSPAAQTIRIPTTSETWIFASSKALTQQAIRDMKLPLNASEARRLSHESAMVESAMITRVSENGISEIQHFLLNVKTEPPLLVAQPGETLIFRRDETGMWIVSR
jgi:hypothetical protein